MSIKTDIDIAAGVIVLLFLWWVFHQGELRIQADDAKVVAAQIIHNDEVNKAAQSAIAAAEEHYREVFTQPTLAPVHVSVCNTANPIALPSGSDGDGPGNGSPDVSAAVGPKDTDIGPFTDHLLDQADAQIEALQAIIQAQQTQMVPNGKPR